MAREDWFAAFPDLQGLFRVQSRFVPQSIVNIGRDQPSRARGHPDGAEAACSPSGLRGTPRIREQTRRPAQLDGCASPAHDGSSGRQAVRHSIDEGQRSKGERREGHRQRPPALQRGTRSRAREGAARDRGSPRGVRSTGRRRRALRAVGRAGVRGVLRRGRARGRALAARAATSETRAAAPSRARDRRETAATPREPTAVALLGGRERGDARCWFRGGGPHDEGPCAARRADDTRGVRCAPGRGACVGHRPGRGADARPQCRSTRLRFGGAAGDDDDELASAAGRRWLVTSPAGPRWSRVPAGVDIDIDVTRGRGWSDPATVGGALTPSAPSEVALASAAHAPATTTATRKGRA